MNVRRTLFGLLLLGWATAGLAQVTLTQTTTADFLMGTGNNVVISNDMVSLQSKMTAMYDFEATTNLPKALMNHQLVTWKNYVFCVGGYNGTAPVNNVYRASQQSDGVSSWTEMNSLPVPLTDMAVVATQGYLVVMGGKNNDGVSKKIYVASLDPYDATMGEWTESSVTLPRALWGARAIVVHDNIYLIGGATTDNETAALKYVYCLKLNSCGNVVSATAVKNLPEARNGHAVATYDSKIYVLGGYNNSGVLKSTVYCATVNLDGTLGSWSSKTALPVALKNHTAVCTNGIMAVIGGMEAELPSSTVYYTSMDSSTLSWSVGNAVLSARTHSGASVAFGNKFFFTGGMNLSGSIVNFNRYATLETGNAKVKKACFVSLPFDLGIPMKNVHQLSYNIAQASNTSYEVLYRLAGEDLVFGNWISAGTDNPVVIDQTKQAIQFMVRLTSNGTNDIQLEDVSATISGYTQLAGNLNNMSVLPIENSPYWVTSDITFTTGVHDIDPGVVIYFSKNTGLDITYACVHFNGTATDPVLLAYNDEDQSAWRGVYFTGSSGRSNGGVYNNNVSSMNYTVIENAGKGGNGAALRLYYANQPTITHCTVSNSADTGIDLIYSNSNISNCTLINNVNTALYLNNSNPTVTSTTMSGSYYGVYVAAGNPGNYTDCETSDNNIGFYSYTPNRSYTYNENTLRFSNNEIDIKMASGTINADCTWNKYDNGYWVSNGHLYIRNSSSNSSPTLTIAPGSTIYMDSGQRIYIGGGASNSYQAGIYAVGNATDSIRFTSKNGEVGGWGGFYFDNSSDYNSSSSLRYCIIEKATTNIYSYYTTQPQLMYSTIRKASGNNISLSYSEINMDQCFVSDASNGICLNNGSTATMVMCTFDNHTNACAYHNDTESTTNFYNCIMKNSNVGVYYHDPDVTIPAYANPNRLTFNNVTSPIGVDGGYVRTNRTWLVNNYSIFGDVKVYYSTDTIRLTLDPGSTLRFAKDKQLQIGYYYTSFYPGQLYAEGTEEAPITFTSLNGESGGWNGLNFTSGSAGPSLLKHCIIENGSTHNILASNSNPTIENCEIRNSNGVGLRLKLGNTISDCEIHDNATYGVCSESSSTCVMENCNFYGNGDYGLYYLYPNGVGGVMNNLHFSGNGTDGIRIGDGTTSSNLRLTNNRTWSAYDYHIYNTMEVGYSNDTICLTLNPGSTLRFAEGKQFIIGQYFDPAPGLLYAEGAEEAPITFTSLNGESGGWYGLYFNYGSNKSLLNHCIIEKATTNVYLYSAPTIENCDIRYASGRGMYFSGASPRVEGSQIHHNGSNGMVLNYSSPTIIQSRIYNNGGNGMYLNSNTNPTVKLSRIFNNGENGIYLYNNSNINPTIGNTTLIGNDIVANGSYAIYQDGSKNLEMAYNFLGIVDSLDIENNLIYDKLDNSDKGRINVFPVSMLPITGNVVEGTMLYDGNPDYTMPGSTIKVKTFADSLLCQTTTDANGHFTIGALNVAGAKKMEFVPNVNVGACITTVDALAVMLHYVHESMLTGSRLAASDVNGSFTVNGTDALLIQKRYVNQISTFPNGDMYYHLYDAVAYPIDTCQVAITALCYGDVNGSYHQLRDGVSLMANGQMLVESGQEYNIPVKVQHGIEAGAISLKLAYPAEYIDMVSVTLPNGAEAMTTDNEGVLTISWYDLNTLYLRDEDVLMTLKVRTKDLSGLDEPILFELGGYSEIADGSAVILSDVVLTMPEMANTSILGVNGHADDNELALSVYPNPVKDHCTVNYTLSSEGSVSFVVYDLLGNAVQAIEEGRQTVGQHQMELNNLASGIYFGRLTFSGSNEKVQIVKIVVE